MRLSAPLCANATTTKTLTTMAAVASILAVTSCGSDTPGNDPSTQGTEETGSSNAATSSSSSTTTSTSTTKPNVSPSEPTPAASSTAEAGSSSESDGVSSEPATDATETGGQATATDAVSIATSEGATPTSDSQPSSGPTTTTEEPDNSSNLAPFSFFVTSYKAMKELSGKTECFGGDLRYGQPTGLEGADKICEEVAERSMPGSAAKGWRAFLSATKGPDGQQVDAITRIGEGPWYDRLGRLVAMTTDDLAQTRPRGADPAIIDDLPNEDGVGNHAPDGTQIDNHHTLTGSDEEGRLYSATATCKDWTSTEKSADGRPRIGFSWPAQSRQHWISGQDEGGCLAGIDLDGGGGGDPNIGTVGSGGGYGQIYCFALTP